MTGIVAFMIAGLLTGLTELVLFIVTVVGQPHAAVVDILLASLHIISFHLGAAMVTGGLFVAIRRVTPLPKKLDPSVMLSTLLVLTLVLSLAYFYVLKKDFKNIHLLGLLLAVAAVVTAWLGTFVHRLLSLVASVKGGHVAKHVILGVLAVVFFVYMLPDLKALDFVFLPVLAVLVGVGIALTLVADKLRLVVGRLPRLIALATMLAVAALNIGLIFPTYLDSSIQKGVAGGAYLYQTYLELGAKLTDFDGDGFSSFFSEGDCAAFDATISPASLEILGDGIDQDCDGEDPTSFATVLAEPVYFEDDVFEGGKLNVILITVDALRKDHMGMYGYEVDTTPNLDALAKESVVFEHSYALSAQTRYSLGGILTGQPASVTIWNKIPGATIGIDEVHPQVQQIIQKAGIFTAAILDCFRIFQGNFGFERGFDFYDDETCCVKTYKLTKKNAKERTDYLIDYLETLQGKDQFYLWTHYLDPHGPYTLPKGVEALGDEDADQYDALIGYVDEHLGRLFDAIKKQGLWDSTVIIVTGDHGEEFREHGKLHHGKTLYNESVGVPIIVKIPGVTPKVLQTPASHLDLAPTILNILGVGKKTWPRYYGKNLLPYLMGAELDNPQLHVFIENRIKRDTRFFDFALLEYPYKIIYKAKKNIYELYDIEHDYFEQENLYYPTDPISAKLRKSVQELVFALKTDYIKLAESQGIDTTKKPKAKKTKKKPKKKAAKSKKKPTKSKKKPTKSEKTTKKAQKDANVTKSTQDEDTNKPKKRAPSKKKPEPPSEPGDTKQ